MLQPAPLKSYLFTIHHCPPLIPYKLCSTDSRTSAHPQFIQIELSILPTGALPISKDATARHHGGTTAHICHGCRKFQCCWVVCCDAHLYATGPLVYQAINSNLEKSDITGHVSAQQTLFCWAPHSLIQLMLTDRISVTRHLYLCYTTVFFWHNLQIFSYSDTYTDQHSSHILKHKTERHDT